MISLEQAKELVAHLESGDKEKADALFLSVADNNKYEIYKQVGQLTRQLHNSLSDFKLDGRVNKLAKNEIPSARDHLNYVISTTEAAANRTMDAVEAAMPLAESMNTNLEQVRPNWNRFMTGEISLNDFKPLCHQIETLLAKTERDGQILSSQLTEIMMAQDYQDLTGQTIKKVIELVREVEEELVSLLTIFGVDSTQEQSIDNVINMEDSGPVINKDRVDVVCGQDDVDDLLASLGF